MNIKSKSNIFYICMLLLAMTLPVTAAPFTTNISGKIDWILINTGPDTYGIGTSIMSLGDTYDFSMTHDSDSATFYTGSDGTGVNYDFSGSPYGGSLLINGNNFSSLTSALNVVDNAVLPPPPDFSVIQPLVDAGIPSDLSGFVIDVYWMGVTSDDFSWDSNGEFQGLELSVVFLDLSGTVFNNTLIPDSVPTLDTIDFAFFQIEQWENGNFVFQAGGMLANNFSPVPTFLASGWEASNFLTLSLPTRSIAFDSSNNLYIEDISDNNSGTVQILKLDAATGYSLPAVQFASYGTGYAGVTGLDFDGLGSLYVSEGLWTGDAGVIREIDVTTQTLLGDVMTFANHRPTGVDADVDGNVFYTGRKESDGTFGNVYQIDSIGVRSILIDTIVGTGIAVDTSGNIFVSTPDRTDLALLSNSIYMFRSSDASLLNPVLIATFNETGGELTFDDDDSLYMIADNKRSISKLIPADTDGDGLADYIDNCILVHNADQRDIDSDGYGNICDADLNQDLETDLSDFSLFRIALSTTQDPDADFNGDGNVDLSDWSLFRGMFGNPPGPSGLNP